MPSYGEFISFFLQLSLPYVNFQHVIAQPCTAEKMAIRPGSWKAGLKCTIRNIAAADLVNERSFLQNLKKRISSVYSQVGLEVNYSTSWFKDDNQGYVADPFSLQTYPLHYLCDDSPKGFYVEIASATNVVVMVNSTSICTAIAFCSCTNVGLS